MSRYYRRKKSKCRNGWKQCGNSPRCFPPETICANEKKRKEKKSPADKPARNEKVKKNERKVPYKALIAGAVAVTIAGASVGYLMTKKKEVIPKPFEPEPGHAPEGMKTYDPSKRNVMNVDASKAAASNEDMFTPQSSIKGRARKADGSVDTSVPNTSAFSREDLNENQKLIKKENRMKAQQWAHEVLMDPDTVILDLETTGLMKGVDPYAPDTWKKQRGNVPGIAQIGLVDKDLNSIDISMNPGKKIGKEAAAVIGRSDKEFQNLPTFKEYYPNLKKYLTGKRVIAFNSRFDMQVIDALCIENDLPLIQYKNRPVMTPGGKNINSNAPLNNDADAMHWWALYLGKGIAPGMSGGKYDPKKGIAYASLPTLPNAKAHDARADCFSTYDVLRIMAQGATPNLNRLNAKERKAWLNSQ